MKSDHEINTQILNLLDPLNIDQLVLNLDTALPDPPLEMHPIIGAMKSCLEKLLRSFIILGGWANEKTIKIRQTVDPVISDLILGARRSINLKNLVHYTYENISDIESNLELVSNLLRIQFHLWKWISYLCKKYGTNIQNFLKFYHE